MDGAINMEIAVDSNVRLLKVAEVGDFYKKRTRPQIRLEGKWLADAGIQPNTHVKIENPQPGVLVLRTYEI